MATGFLHVLLLDPDEKSRAELKKGLAAHAAFQVVNEAEEWEEAAVHIRKKAPDAIFGDPFLGKKSDLEWVDEVPASVAVVLVASHPRLALQAFEKRVLDYVLKPVAASRLKLTLARLIEWKSRPMKLAREARTEKKIVIQTRRESVVVSPHTISCIKAEGNYTNLILRDGTRKMVHRSLRQWKGLLPAGLFFQVHRSTLVNIEQVRQLEGPSVGKHILHLTGYEDPMPVSRRMASQFKKRLQSLG